MVHEIDCEIIIISFNYTLFFKIALFNENDYYPIKKNNSNGPKNIIGVVVSDGGRRDWPLAVNVFGSELLFIIVFLALSTTKVTFMYC